MNTISKHGLVIIGGGGAGLTAALAAKKTSFETDITLITKDCLSYSPCALPFVISREIEDFGKISKGLEDICKMSGIKYVFGEAVSIDVKNKTVKTKHTEIPYGRLIIATGGNPSIPPIKGAHLRNVYTLHRIEDAQKISEATKDAKHAVVVGGGPIGLEAAAAFRELGIKVALVEGLEYVLCRLFDPDYCQLIEKKLEEKGIELVKGKNVEEIVGADKVMAVKVAGREIPADIVVLSTGVRPGIKIVENTGIEVSGGGIKTDEYTETNVKGIYAAGDCTITKSVLTGKHMPSLLGTTAIRQGTVAGINAAGGHAVFDGVLGSTILKIFDLEVGRCGLTEKEAKAEGIETVTGRVKSTTTAEYYPKGKWLELKLLFEAKDGKIIGAQVVGGGGVAGKINLLTFAISRKATVEDLVRLEYCYTPPLAPSHNPIVLAAENAYRKMKRTREKEKR